MTKTPSMSNPAGSGTGETWTLPAVPALWRIWHEAGAIPSTIRLAISAGARLPLTLEKIVFERCGVKIHNFLGASECGGIAYDGTDTPRGDDSYVGSALRNVHLGSNAEGCLVVQGRAVGETYWPVKESVLADGNFETSDLVELRERRWPQSQS